MSFDGAAANAITGPWDVTINGVQIGHTEENVEDLTAGDSNTQHMSHESGLVAFKETRGATPISFRLRAIEITKEVMDLVFPEATSVSAAGIATFSDKSITVLTAVSVTLHPSDTVGADNDQVYNNMVPFGPKFEGPQGRENKYLLTVSFRNVWTDTTISHVIKGNATPA